MAIKLGDALVMIGGDRSKLQQDFKGAEKDTRSWVPKIGGILEIALGGLLRKSIEGLTSMVKNFGRELLGTVTQAAKVSAISNTFERLVEVVGGDAVKAMNDLRFATRGMVSDSDLMQASNKFLSMGIATSAEEAANLAEVATQLGTAMGTDAATAMEDFALMMANQSIPRLDTFGISSGKVRARIEELTAANADLTREQAFNIAVMEQAEIAMKRVGEQGDTAAASLSKINSGWENITLSIGKLFLPIAEKVLGWAGDFVTYLSKVFETGETFNDYLDKLPAFLRPIAETLGKAVVFLKEQFVPGVIGLFDAFSKLLEGDVSGFLWGIHDALVAFGVPEETLVHLEEILVTIWAALVELRDGDVEGFIGHMKAALLELGVPVDVVLSLETAFRNIYAWMVENLPKIEEAVTGIWEDILKPALDGLLELVKDLLPGALTVFGAILLAVFVVPMLLAALPVIALGAALIALGLIWGEYGDQVQVTLGKLGAIIANVFGQAIEWVMGLLQALLAIPGGEFLYNALRIGEVLDGLEEMKRRMAEIAVTKALEVVEREKTAKTPGDPFAGVKTLLERLGAIGGQDNRQNVTVYGGVQQYGVEEKVQALLALWELGQ